MKSTLTDLEFDLLRHFHVRYSNFGFPPPAEVGLKSREVSGAGRFTYVEHDGCVQLRDGQVGLGLYSQFDMPGLEAGCSFWVEVAQMKIQYLEMIVNGGGDWDGSEFGWIVRDPETGELPAEGAA